MAAKRKTTQRRKRHQKQRAGVGRQRGGALVYKPKKGGALDIQKVLEKRGLNFTCPVINI